MKNLNFLFFFFLIFISCNQPQPISAQGCSFDLNITENECGEATLKVENCSDCSSYNWNTGASSRSLIVTQSGTYRVTVTSFTNQCTSVAQVSVQVAPPCNQGCSFDIATTNSGCGQATLEVVNCPDCFAYQWSNGATSKMINVTSSGTYSVTVTGGGGACTSKASKTVEVSSVPSVNISGDGYICEESSTMITANVEFGVISYCWNTGAKSPGILVSQSGTYTVTVTEITTGCTAVATKEVVMVNKPQTPTISAEVVGDKVVLTAYPPAAHYMWSNGATTPTVTVNSSMTLSVRIKNHEGCISEASCPVPVMVLVKEINNGGSDPANCNKNGIVTSNGMSYGAVVKKPNSQLFLYAPPGANQYSCKWNHEQNGGNKGWILANSNVGTHQYLLQCKLLGSEDWHWYCFQYTIVNNIDENNIESRSIYSSEEMFIPEEYREEIEEFLNQASSSNYENSERVNMNVYPNPTTGPIRIEAEMEIPLDAMPGVYIFKGQLFDINGKTVGVGVEKVIKQ
jgi:hypothetical protein